ncbi:PREDICTED: nucleolar protein 9 [Ceratosolen solmsi marchali]|uniref:Nucleolar protein 9 n=1 Tax=Ceratosolen solmsi marchali TaxID=326594 RepID=A0AAJ7E1H2_9HYME|nr:PREDICTED: nucleolar protein 9 [Ceratosolen solmsi marchali]
MESQNENSHKNMKRKKRRSAMQMAKKFARRRNYDGELDTETYQYMVHVLEIIRSEFPTMSDKQIFVDNVYQQTNGREIEFARNQVGSRVLDSLIKYAGFDTIVRFAESFNEVLRPFNSDRFASHVLQKLICVCAHRGNITDAEDHADTEKVKHSEALKYNEIALKLCKYSINNVEEFIWDMYANHVLRTAIECLGGLIDLSENNDKKKFCPNLHTRRKVIKEYTDLLIATCQRLYDLPQFPEFNHDNLTSGLVQSTLYSLKGIDSDLNSCIIKKICNDCFTGNDENKLSNIFLNECSMRLLEVCLSVSEPKDYTIIYERFFENHLGELSLMKGANFSVQRLFEHCHTKEIMEKIFDEISEHLKDILLKGHTGIFSSLAKACGRLRAKQGSFINIICKILNCEQNDRQTHIVSLVSTLKTYEEYQNEGKTKLPINLHGSLTVQAMLNFNKPIKIVNSLLGISAEELSELFDDPKGSRIMDAFMDSEYIGEKSRDKLAKCLQGTWAKLACSTHGSRSLDKVWAWAKQNQKLIIMEELADIGESLRSTNAGRIISTKLNVALFARNKQDWLQSQGKEEKTRALFADIIGSAKKATL